MQVILENRHTGFDEIYQIPTGGYQLAVVNGALYFQRGVRYLNRLVSRHTSL